MRQFEDQLSDRSYRSIEQALVVWLEDFRAKKQNGNVGLKAPSYGNKINLLLLVDVKARMLAGLPVDDASLRFLLCLELGVSVEHINADRDPVFTGYRNQNVSDSDSSDSD